MKASLRIIFLILLASSVNALADGPQYLHAPGVDPANLPYSEAVRVGELLFLSGMIGLEPGTRQVVKGGIQPETRATLEAIRGALERHGSAMDRVVNCNVFLADIAEWPAMNEVYVEFFPVNRPARTAVEASALPLGARVEIACIATTKTPVAFGKLDRSVAPGPLSTSPSTRTPGQQDRHPR